MPAIGLGTFGSDHVSADRIAEAVKAAARCGYRHFDCASVYGNEAEVGQGLKEAMEELNIPREEIFVTSKLWNCFHHPGVIPNLSSS